jgi:pimeloyl-ACP methyl ester carboxylesterase
LQFKGIHTNGLLSAEVVSIYHGPCVNRYNSAILAQSCDTGEFMPYKPEDIFVLLPGITGSVLAVGGREVWGPSAGAIFRALKSHGQSVSELELSGDDPELDDLGDGVTATRLAPDVTLIPGFWKIDGYSATAKSLIEHFGLVRGESFFDFPYDWRRHNAVAARKLARSVQSWLAVRKAAVGGEPRVILVAHSMGGLVARHFLEVLGGWQHTRALLTFGTPYRGSLNALGYLATGYKSGGLDLTSLLRTLPSVYELLPIYPCVYSGSEEPKRVAEMSELPHVDQTRAAKALAFHRAIESAQKNNASLKGYGYKIVPCVGFEQPTMQSARFEAGELKLLPSRGGKDESGDGTVPRVSATPIEVPNELGATFASERHGSLQNNDGLLAHVRGVLTQPDTGVVLRARAGLGVGLSLRLEDAYAEGEEIEVGVTAAGEFPEMEALLEDAVTGAEVTTAPVRRGGEAGQRVIFDPLPPGHYRVTIRGAGVSPIRDVFLVGR